jgi:hypothetical protein
MENNVQHEETGPSRPTSLAFTPRKHVDVTKHLVARTGIVKCRALASKVVSVKVNQLKVLQFPRSMALWKDGIIFGWFPDDMP